MGQGAMVRGAKVPGCEMASPRCSRPRILQHRALGTAPRGTWHPGTSHPSTLTRGTRGTPAPLEVIPNPERELDLAQPFAAADEVRPVAFDVGAVGEDEVFPVAVEERPPRPVEVNGEAEHERFEAYAVRGAAVDQAEAVDRNLGAEDRLVPGGRERVLDVAEQRRVSGRLGGPHVGREKIGRAS